MIIKRTTTMKQIGATALVVGLFVALSLSAWGDSGARSSEEKSFGAQSIERALLVAAESSNAEPKACRASCDEKKVTCNEKCVGVTAGSCFARCAQEQEACHVSCGGESKGSN